MQPSNLLPVEDGKAVRGSVELDRDIVALANKLVREGLTSGAVLKIHKRVAVACDGGASGREDGKVANVVAAPVAGGPVGDVAILLGTGRRGRDAVVKLETVGARGRSGTENEVELAFIAR